VGARRVDARRVGARRVDPRRADLTLDPSLLAITLRSKRWIGRSSSQIHRHGRSNRAEEARDGGFEVKVIAGSDGRGPSRGPTCKGP
jgi:hypothetical protein